MCLRQILAIGAFAFVEVRDGIQPKPVHAHFTPVIDDLKNLILYQWIVVVEIGLMIKEAMPVILFCYGIPGPVGLFKILEDDADILVLIWVVRPDIIISLFRTLGRHSRALKPGMLVR